MMRFLRYNSRHSLYYHPTYNSRGGVRILFGWSLDPIGSCYDGKQIVMHEPLWLFRLRQRWFAFAGRQKCGRRGDSWHGQTDVELPDTWDLGPDGNRTCSYCGSIHFDDLMAICRKVPDDEGYSIDGTDKAYKVYVRQPGVMNASQGAIKYYKHHTPSNVSDADQEAFANAARISADRSRKQMESRFGQR